MNKLSDIIKRFLNFLLTSLKTLLTIIYGFFAELFQPSKANEELKSKSLEQMQEHTHKQETAPKDFSEFQDEDPEVLSFMPNNYQFNITNEEIILLIEMIFCEELELDKQLLTKKEKQYIKDLQERLIPTLSIGIESQEINTKDELQYNIRVLVKNNLESQLKLEQNYSSDNEKIVITPLIYERNPETIYPTFNPHTFFKEKRKELKSDVLEVHDIPKSVIVNDNPKKQEVAQNMPTMSYEQLTCKPLEKVVETQQDIAPKDLGDSYINSVLATDSNINIDRIESLEEIVEIPKISMVPEISVENILKSETVLECPILEEQVTPKQTEVPQDIVRQLPQFDTYQEKELEKQINEIQKQWELENQKEELEDKEFQIIEKQIQILLDLIEKLKLRNLSPEQKIILLKKEKELVDLKNTIDNRKQKDISLEQEILNETIFQEDLNKLELEMQNLYLNDQNGLQQFMINRLEDLDYINPERAKQIEKELLKRKLQDAIKSLELSYYLSLPFLNNRYLLYLTMGIFTNRHLKTFQAVLNRKTVVFEPFLLEHIKRGVHAFYEAIALTEENINYLSILQNQAFDKYPELSRDHEFNNYIEHLRLLLLKSREKLLKKDKMISKYNLKTQKYLRKRKKKETHE